MDRAQAVRSPLDQLEAQVNLVVRMPGIAALNTIASRTNLSCHEQLEHTGRLFANNARNHGQINNPLRLKQVIAGANNNFHDALDQLEGELVSSHGFLAFDSLRLTRSKISVTPFLLYLITAIDNRH